jgi:hypothetical protein
MRFLCEYIAFKFLQCETISGIAKLQSFSNKNLFVNPAARGHFSGYVRLPKNFNVTPAAIFASSITIEKLIKAEGLILVKLTSRAIQDSRMRCTFQPSLVYNRVCCGFV